MLAGLALIGDGFYLQAKARLAQWLMERSYAALTEDGEKIRPWPWADSYPVARLTVAELDVDELLLAGASMRNLAFGPVINDQGAMPGSDGHIWLSGHRDTHFSFLRRLEPGMVVAIATPSGNRSYRVDGTQIVDLDRGPVRFSQHAERLTLVTCYPFDALISGTRLRYLVHASAIG